MNEIKTDLYLVRLRGGSHVFIVGGKNDHSALLQRKD